MGNKYLNKRSKQYYYYSSDEYSNIVIKYVLSEILNRKCYVCNNIFDNSLLELDHILPKSKFEEAYKFYYKDLYKKNKKIPYKKDDLENLSIICPPCNKKKRDAIKFLEYKIGYIEQESHRAIKRVGKVRSKINSFLKEDAITVGMKLFTATTPGNKPTWETSEYISIVNQIHRFNPKSLDRHLSKTSLILPTSRDSLDRLSQDKPEYAIEAFDEEISNLSLANSFVEKLNSYFMIRYNEPIEYFININFDFIYESLEEFMNDKYRSKQRSYNNIYIWDKNETGQTFETCFGDLASTEDINFDYESSIRRIFSVPKEASDSTLDKNNKALWLFSWSDQDNVHKVVVGALFMVEATVEKDAIFKDGYPMEPENEIREIFILYIAETIIDPADNTRPVTDSRLYILDTNPDE